MFLEQIRSSADVKQLNDAQAAALCGELREYLVEQLSRTGGHLASNLGAVELTVAIHRVFDTARDRLVFDVGHQCYVHKLLTGRQAAFPTLRQADGLSGFPKPRESIHDAFVAGHASNSISVALGMARARTLQGADYHVLALIGDGAASGGLSFEGFNDAGASGEPLIVILNDNGMSISRNVGGLSGYLSHLRNKPGYYAFKRRYRRAMNSSAAGKKVYRVSHRLKTALKDSILPEATLFEHMGFTYLGPVDGHDLPKLTQALEQARALSRPVLLHVHTVKGKGYPPAEREPDRFHGVGAFDRATGTPLAATKPSFSTVFGAELCELARQDRRICAVTAAMCSGTGLDGFAAEFPDRFFDVGIAEEHATAMAAGMAKQGMVPVFAVYSSFLQRGFDQLLHDVALQRLHVVFAVDRAGLVGADGETHHGCFDPAYLAMIPGMTVLCPSDFDELRAMLRRAVYDCDGPVAIRYPRGGEGSCRPDAYDGALYTLLRPGNEGTIVAYGTMADQALAAAELLQAEGIRAGVLKLNRIAPLTADEAATLPISRRCLVVVEDCLSTGCVGQRLLALLAQKEALPERVRLQNLGDDLPQHGTVSQLLQRSGLDASGIAAAVREVLQ